MRIFTICSIFLVIIGWTSFGNPSDLRNVRPEGKNWVKITDIHYMDKKSVKRIKGTLYQARVCNYASNKRVRFWAYFDVRVDCATKKAWTKSDDKWIGPMDPANYDEGVMNLICK